MVTCRCEGRQGGVTLDIYSHVVPGLQEEGAVAAGRAVFG